MSIQTQIERLEAAKSAIGTAITGKGVTVPDGTRLDGMAALIDDIETGSGGSTPIYELYSYSSSNQPIDDGDGNWRVKFLSSGILTVAQDMNVDIFAVGGGGNGGYITAGVSYGGGGGAGGYTTTTRTIKLLKGETYTVTVGAATGTSSLTNEDGVALCEAAGGGNASSYNGGSGGSGGGPGAYTNWATGYPGSDGNNGTNTTQSTTAVGGKGQGSTTREFGEPDGDLYSGGGGGGRPSSSYSGTSRPGAEGGGGDGADGSTSATKGAENTGGGGGGGCAYSGYTSGAVGGTGIVIIRNARIATA